MNSNAVAFFIIAVVFSTPLIALNYANNLRPHQQVQTNHPIITQNQTEIVYLDKLYLRNVSIDDATTRQIWNSVYRLLRLSDDGITVPRFEIYITSPGGFFPTVLIAGNYLRMLRNSNISVIFYVLGECRSGCFLLSTYATKIYLAKNASYGFGHLSTQYLKGEWMQFVNIIAENKRSTPETIEKLMPSVYTAQEAIALRLADGLYQS